MTSMQRMSRLSWLLALLIVLVLVAIGVPFMLDHFRGDREAKQSQCVAQWAADTSARSSLIATYNGAENTALDEYNKVRDDTPNDRAKVDAYRMQFEATQSQLSEQLAAHPPPVYRCGGVRPSVPSVSPTTVMPLPTVTHTTTATTTKTQPLPTPGPTVTQRIPGSVIRLPGSFRTVTVTQPAPKPRTVTRTVSPPSCLVNPIPPCILG